MSFTEFFIRRPSFTIVLMLIITIFGCISFFSLPIRWIPSVHPPVISIYTSYEGASANLMESQITTPIESALSGIEGVESMTSSSRQGESSITLNFKLGHNIDQAVEDVRSNLSHVTGLLPRDAAPPYISKANTEEMPILFLAFADNNMTPKAVSDYVDSFIIPQLQTTEGVATVMSYGRRASVMRIQLDPLKMAASKVTVEDVGEALQSQNVQVPSGQIRARDRFYNVVTNENLNSADQFNQLVIRKDNNQTIRLKNIGEAVIAPLYEDSSFRVNGQQAVAVGIIPQSTANPLAVANDVLKIFQMMKHNLPQGMQANVIYNEADFIKSSIHSVYEALVESVFFVVLVIFIFLGSLRATLIPLVTIPVCLISTFALIYYFGFSLNTITLMAFVLAIGLVVDDAIVMVENISRYVEKGFKPLTAAIIGSKEIIFPIIAMTLTLAAVYTPIALTSGILNSVFREFALTLTSAVLISGVVALTLSPMMSSRLLSKMSDNAYQAKLNFIFVKFQNNYEVFLSWILQKKILISMVLGLMAVVGLIIFHYLPSELAPTEDRDEVDVYVSAPHDASFQFTDEYVKKLEQIYQTIPEVQSYLAEVGDSAPSTSYQILNLVPKKNRKRTAAEIAQALNDATSQFPGVKIWVSVPPSPLTWFSGGEGNNIGLAVMSPSEYKDIHLKMEQFINAAKKSPAFLSIDSQLKWDRNQFEINLDREKISDLNLSMQNITNTISTLFAGKNIGKFEYGGQQYDILLQMDKAALTSPNVISELYVRNPNSNMISLADFTSIKETSNPGSLSHYNRLRADNLFANLAPGYTVANAVTILQNLAKQNLPDNMKISFMGEAQNYLESNHKILFTFLLALVFIYLVLVAQFESFIDPFIILITVPFAMTGALLALKLTGCTLNIYSNIGLVTLIGLIAKHGILITEFANQSLAKGVSISEAIISAAILRLRPILMTTAAMILGALPLALAVGPGSETRHQVGWVIVGGMFIGTLFSLVAVPIVYSVLAQFKKSNSINTSLVEDAHS